MSAAVADVRAFPSATWRTTRVLVGRALRIVAIAAPLLLAMGVGVIPALVAFAARAGRHQVEGPESAWFFAVQQAPGIFALVIAAMTIAHLATHLAFGMTRRSFASAVVLTVLAVAAVFALLVPIGYVLEGAHYRAYGWMHEPPDSLALAALASALRSAVWGTAGALTAAIWYRFGGFVGVSALPFTAVYPIVTASLWIERSAVFGLAEVALLVGAVMVLSALYALAVVGAPVRRRAA